MHLTDGERAQLAATFGCAPDELDARISLYTDAAREEYLRMVLGQRVFTRGQDIREYRLLLLIQHVFGGRLPSEAQVCAIFQTTTTQSRTLLRSVLAKFQYDLQEVTVNTLRDVLANATDDRNTKNARRLNIDNTNVIDALNRLIASIDGSLPLATKVQGTGSSYLILGSSFQKISEHLA
jgi:hypothetical protein